VSKLPQIPLDLSPTPNYKFANFLVSESNVQAVKIVRAWPEWTSPILIVIGPQGCGKTHLGQAWASETGGIFVDDANGANEADLFAIMNRALNGEIAGLMLAARQAPSEWTVEMPDLRSRLSNAPVAIIGEHDDKILEPIVRRIYEHNGRDVSQDLIAYLLKYQERSVAAQRIIADELEAAARSQKADLTKSFASKYLKTRLERDLFAVPSKE
jgi:chromosomal replication initiation ATPase DnaA